MMNRAFAEARGLARTLRGAGLSGFQRATGARRMSNAIVVENSPEGEWGLSGGESTEIEGFTADISHNIGQTVELKVDSVAGAYRIDVCRIGSDRPGCRAPPRM